MSKLTIGDVILYLVPHNLAARKVVENNPRRWSKPPGDSTTSIVLTFNDQPKEVRSGFLLGYGKEADIHLVSSTESKAYITFNCTSGLAILINSKAVEGASFKLIVDGLAFRCDGAQFGIRVPQRGRYQAHYADRLSKYLALMTPNPTNPVKGIYADPITPKAEVGCYWEIKKVGNGAFGEVCLFAHRPTGQMFAGKRFNNPRDIQAILTEIKTLRSARHVSRMICMVCC